MTRSALQVLAMPALVALASAVGLLSALLADGWADALSWWCLGGAAALGLVLGLRRGRRHPGR